MIPQLFKYDKLVFLTFLSSQQKSNIHKYRITVSTLHQHYVIIGTHSAMNEFMVVEPVMTADYIWTPRYSTPDQPAL